MAEQAAAGEMLLTVFLKHRQSMNLAEINQKLEATGFWQKFPPEGVEVVSWYVMMGIGQVVTLKAAGRAAARGQSGDRAERLGRVRDRVLPDLRLPPDLAGDQSARLIAVLTATGFSISRSQPRISSGL